MRYRRVEPVDSLEIEGESILLYENAVVRLGELGTVLFQALAEPRSVPELAALLVSEFGPPPHGDETSLTEKAIADLCARLVVAPA